MLTNTNYLRLQRAWPRAWVKAQYRKKLSGETFLKDHCKLVVSGNEPWIIDKPNGGRLLEFWPGAADERVCEKARSALRLAGRKFSSNLRPYQSAIIGHFDKGAPPLPPCRTTAFTGSKLKEWLKCQSFINAVDDVFAARMPERYAAQLAYAARTPTDLVIGNTSFTTTTVNLWDEEHDAQTPVHTDTGDLAAGFGVMSAVTAGDYTGGLLVFIKYGVAVDLRTTDVLLADVHEAHCNTPIVPGSKPWERLSTIHYYRSEMAKCPANSAR